MFLSTNMLNLALTAENDAKVCTVGILISGPVYKR